VAKRHSQHQLTKRLIFFKQLQLLLNSFTRVYPILDGHCSEDHLVGSKRASLISKDAVNQSQLLHYRRIQHSAVPLQMLVVQLPIERQKDGRESLDSLDEDVEGDGYEKVEKQEDGEED